MQIQLISKAACNFLLLGHLLLPLDMPLQARPWWHVPVRKREECTTCLAIKPVKQNVLWTLQNNLLVLCGSYARTITVMKSVLRDVPDITVNKHLWGKMMVPFPNCGMNCRKTLFGALHDRQGNNN